MQSPRCEQENQPGAGVCSSCGAGLGLPVPRASTATRLEAGSVTLVGLRLDRRRARPPRSSRQSPTPPSTSPRRFSGDYRAAERVCRTWVESLRDQPIRERFGLAIFPAVVSRAHLARVLAELGEFDEADAHGHEAIRIAEALDHPFSVSLGCSILRT
jgi:hypothetical protein